MEPQFTRAELQLILAVIEHVESLPYEYGFEGGTTNLEKRVKELLKQK